VEGGTGSAAKRAERRPQGAVKYRASTWRAGPREAPNDMGSFYGRLQNVGHVGYFPPVQFSSDSHGSAALLRHSRVKKEVWRIWAA